MESWQKRTKTTTERLRELYQNKYLTDCVLKTSDKEANSFSVHKLILAMSSRVWERIMSGQSDNSTVVLLDIDSKTLDIILRYVYLNEIHLKTVEESLNTYKVAKKYGMQDLHSKCLAYSKTYLDPENICEVYQSVMDTPELRDLLTNMIFENKHAILNSKSFTKAQKEVVMEITKLIGSKVNPTFIITKLIIWAKNQDVPNLKAALEEFLPAISFSTFSPSPTIFNTKNLIPTDVEVELQYEIYQDDPTVKSLECCFLTRQKGLVVQGFSFKTWFLPSIWIDDQTGFTLKGVVIVEDEGTGRLSKEIVDYPLSGDCTDDVKIILDRPVRMVPGKSVKIRFVPSTWDHGRAFCVGKYEKCVIAAARNTLSVYVLEFSDYNSRFSRVSKQGLIEKLILKIDPRLNELESNCNVPVTSSLL